MQSFRKFKSNRISKILDIIPTENEEYYSLNLYADKLIDFAMGGMVILHAIEYKRKYVYVFVCISTKCFF